MVGVFSGVIKHLTHREKQSSTDNEASAHIVRLVEVTSSMVAWGSARSGCKSRCAGRWIGGRTVHVSMQKCLHKGVSTRLRDNIFSTVFYTALGARTRAVVSQGFYTCLYIAGTL